TRPPMFPNARGTVNGAPLLASPRTETTTGPVAAPAGTAAVISAALHEPGVAATPLNVTRLVSCAAPKLDPVIVIAVPAAPEAGDRLLIAGARMGRGATIRES